jgi:heme-degrading monooxygenase HmoA
MIQYRRMLQIVWEFRINTRKRKQFEANYSANGSWAKLFRKGSGFIETILIRDREMPDRYLTIDIWKDLASFNRFKKRFKEQYQSLDQECEDFTIKEECLGQFVGVRRGMWR